MPKCGSEEIRAVEVQGEEEASTRLLVTPAGLPESYRVRLVRADNCFYLEMLNE
ncbi:hypothetical protein [Thermogymnomonas acidicola]|uniref:hypothetical protein n=1 Tax=Thermogymnomonas acidicola TaxID=399579 RepID=UPI0014947171|nr:hypothetical protein [Thermogymnomonas acidicola]